MSTEGVRMTSVFRRTLLGVNVDHIATIRQARGTQFPDPVYAAAIAESSGADQITIHLREDRRHIQERDLEILRQTIQTRLNLEMAATQEMMAIALANRPDMVTLVPESREEKTTEGGLDVVNHFTALQGFIQSLRSFGGHVSLFVDPDEDQIRASSEMGVDYIEIHTGDYCSERHLFHSATEFEEHRAREFQRIESAALLAAKLNLRVAAGHGLDYDNVTEIVNIGPIEEVNIGHSIVARALFVGFEAAVAQMAAILRRKKTV
jgi:pyridoxine 5-phosphate synthase